MRSSCRHRTPSPPRPRKLHREITTDWMNEVLKPILDDIAETMASETVEQDLAGDPGEWIEEAYE
jgi:hypothetical protein